MSAESILNRLLSEGPAAPAPTRTAPAPTRTSPSPRPAPRPGTRPWRPNRPAVTPRPKGFGDEEDEIDDEEEELGLGVLPGLPGRRGRRGALRGRPSTQGLISAIAHECKIDEDAPARLHDLSPNYRREVEMKIQAWLQQLGRPPGDQDIIALARQLVIAPSDIRSLVQAVGTRGNEQTARAMVPERKRPALRRPV